MAPTPLPEPVRASSGALPSLPHWRVAGFAVAWLLPVGMAVALWRSPAAAGLWALSVQGLLAAIERLPAAGWAPEPVPRSVYRLWLRGHALLQAGLIGLALGLAPGAVTAALETGGVVAGLGVVLSMGVGVGMVTGAQGITFAHELGHSRSRLDRALAWGLMGSVGYAHFMVEHYRGHHVRVATADDPASAPRGMTLWRFLPRTLAGSWRSAWRLDRAARRARGRTGWRSPLRAAMALQVGGALAIGLWIGPWALAVWAVQAAYAVFLLETINYVEHYGLQRSDRGGRPEPFAAHHAWNADRPITNLLIANLQRHSDHHLNPARPYETLRALDGPQLPTGYAGCILLALWPSRWFAVMEPRLRALDALPADGASGSGAVSVARSPCP